MIAQIRRRDPQDPLDADDARARVGMLVLVIAISVLDRLLDARQRSQRRPEDQRQLLNTGSLAGIFAALAGILVVTSETRFGTIRPTFLVSPSWRRIIGAKVVASFSAGLVMGIVGMLVSYGIGYLCLSQRDIPFLLDSGDIAWLLVGAIVGSAIWGGIGVGIGTVVRNQIGAVIAFLALALRAREHPLRPGALGRAMGAGAGAERVPGLDGRRPVVGACRRCGAAGVDGRARRDRARADGAARRGVTAGTPPRRRRTPPEGKWTRGPGAGGAHRARFDGYYASRDDHDIVDLRSGLGVEHADACAKTGVLPAVRAPRSVPQESARFEHHPCEAALVCARGPGWAPPRRCARA